MPQKKGVSKEKFDSCVEQVKEKQGKKVNAYAVCNASLGKEEVKKQMMGSAPPPPPPMGTVATAGGSGTINSQIGFPFGKQENPDKEADAQLGEDVEHLVEEHFQQNPEAEEKEGHKLTVKKAQNKLDDKIVAMKKAGSKVAPNHPKMPAAPKLPGAPKTHGPKIQAPAPKIQKSDKSNKEMAATSVANISSKADYLHGLMSQLEASKDTPAWAVEKIGQAKTHLQDVMDYVKGQHMEKSKSKLDEKIDKMKKASSHLQEEPKEPYVEDVSLIDAAKRDPKERLKEKIGMLKEMAAFLKSGNFQKAYMGFEALKEKAAAGGAKDPAAAGKKMKGTKAKKSEVKKEEPFADVKEFSKPIGKYGRATSYNFSPQGAVVRSKGQDKAKTIARQRMEEQSRIKPKLPK